jgi:hypothetical protein
LERRGGWSGDEGNKRLMDGVESSLANSLEGSV